MESLERTWRRCGLALEAGLVWLGVLVALLAGAGSDFVPAAAAAEAPPEVWTRCAANGEEDVSCKIPRGIAADPDSGHVFVADQADFRIVEFAARGHFLRAWGWDVVASGFDDAGTGFEICVPGNGDSCKAGTEGAGAGQFGLFGPQGVALDGAGDVYVVDQSNRRVEKFDPDGHFLLTWGGDVASSGPGNTGADERQTITVKATGGKFSLTATTASGSGSLASGSNVISGVSTTLGAFHAGDAISASGIPANTTIAAVGAGTLTLSANATASGARGLTAKENTGATGTGTTANGSKLVTGVVTGSGAFAAGERITIGGATPTVNEIAAVLGPGELELASEISAGGGPGSALAASDIAFDAKANEGEGAGSVEAALGALPGIGAAGVAVSGGPGDATGTAPYTVTFSGGLLKGNDVAPLASATTNLEGTKSAAVATAVPGGGPEVCVPADGDTCKAGVESGSGEGQFGAWKIGSFIAIDPADKVYVGDQNRIQRFDTEGAYQGQIAVPSETVQSLATDSSGNLYAVYSGKEDARKLTPAGVELPSPRFKVKSPSAVAVDPAGHVYAFDPSVIHLLEPANDGPPIFEFEADGEEIARFGKGEFANSTGLATNLCPGDEPPGDLYVSNSVSSPSFVRAYGTPPDSCGKAITGEASNIAETGARLNGKANPKGLAVSACLFEYGTDLTYGETASCAESSGEIGTGTEPVPVHADVVGSLAAGTVYHFRLVVGTASGAEAGSDVTFKTLGPPVLSAEAASNVAFAEATLKALVNPEGFATKYHFEYGLDATYGNSTPVIELGADRSDHPVLANLAGLAPGTSYHWRIVASNSASEKAGHPSEGEDHVFTTYLQPTPEACPNQALRTGAGASLPDCRAYEMVSPVEKNGGDIVHILGEEGYVQTAADGEEIAYSALPTFGDAVAGVSVTQYLSRREAGGWSNHGIHPAAVGIHPVGGSFFGIFREFEAFSPDLCSAWFEDVMAPPLTAAGQEGYVNLYRLDLCGEAGPEALTTAEPPPGTEEAYVNRGNQSVAGYSDDSSHALFAAKAALTAEAAANANAQLYDRFGGGLHLVSVLPNGSADPAADAVGSDPSYNLEGAVSADGSRVYWTSLGGGGEAEGAGTVYLRRHPEQGKVAGECGEASKACTVKVSSGPFAFFWSAAADGSGALFGERGEGGEKLVEFDLQKLEEAKPPRRTIAQHIEGVLGASEDLSRIYFVSKDALSVAHHALGGASEEPEEGEPNLYLDEGGELTYVATLIPGDVGEAGPEETRAYDVVSKIPSRRTARVSPDGAHIAFQSRARLTVFDNTDPANGEADVEVFTYEEGGALACVSCTPSGARPSGPELREPYFRIGSNETHVFASAWIQPPEHPLYASHVLSDDGSRLFFHSYEALVPADANGAMDVYEWERPGAGSCTEKSAAFHAANGGCVYLISSGESPFESEFWDASADGRDVFFSTESKLVPQDSGLVDLYDARIEGGFPQPSQAAECEGEACQSPPPAPQDPTPASAAYRGPGNVRQGKPRCPKGKRKVRRHGKAHCVKKERRHRRADRNRRVAR